MSRFVVIRFPLSKDSGPTVEHTTSTEALKEAERLALANPKYKFRVYSSVCETSAVTYTTTVMLDEENTVLEDTQDTQP
jgi:hypothetical protein